MPRCDNPHVVVHRPTGTRTRHADFASADGYAMAAGRGRPGEFVSYDLTTPHVAVDSLDRGDHGFASEQEARRYIDTANVRAGRTRYSYLDVTV